MLIHISNFRPVKRPEDLIKILQLLKDEIDPVLLLIGDGPLRSRLEKMCRELNLCSSVVFLGKQLSIVELLSLADVYLCTSETESFGLSALEAMGCGVPSVSSDAGGIPEVIDDGINGFLEKVGGVEAMAGRVIELVKDRELYRRFSAAAREKAETTFNIRRIVSRYEDFYRTILEQS